MIYNKLVRDKIPQIMESNGEKAITKILNDEEYTKALHTKLDEEVLEFHQDDNAEELADILEVVFALAKSKGYSEEELLALRNKKREQRGGFDDKIFLIAKE